MNAFPAREPLSSGIDGPAEPQRVVADDLEPLLEVLPPHRDPLRAMQDAAVCSKSSWTSAASRRRASPATNRC